MAASATGVWAVVIADIVGSSRIADLRQARDAQLAKLSQRHLQDGRALARYTVTAWDEFQNVLAEPWALPGVIWDLRLAFQPIELRIGVGLGAVDELPGPETPINEVSSGEAFSLAREAVSHFDKEKRKYTLRTLVRSGDSEVEGTLNLVYMLTDSLLSGLSDRQWETVQVYEETGRLDEAADRLGLKSGSTVSRNLHRGYYWQLLDARRGLEAFLRARFAP